jgi:phosphoglycerate dehydrogenase-like enzyme
MKITNILVAGPYKEEFQKQLPPTIHKNYRFVPVEDITEEDLSWADAYVGFKPSPLFHFKNIKWVHTFNAGVNNYLELNGWEENHVLLTRTVCSFGQRISEYCLSYVLRDLQHQDYFEKKQREKKWAQKTPKMLKEQTVVVFGTGEIGQEVAKTFTQFGSTVYGVSQTGKQKDYFQNVTTNELAHTILPKADWAISTLPLTSETKSLFDSRMFSSFNGASFINVGRGATVDDHALIEALDSGVVHRAILDVLSTEPLPESSDLWGRADVTITPHISAVTQLDEAVTCFIDTLEKIEKNQELTNMVDFTKGY